MTKAKKNVIKAVVKTETDKSLEPQVIGNDELKVIAKQTFAKCRTAQSGENKARGVLTVGLLAWYERNHATGTHLLTFRELKDMVCAMADYDPIGGTRVPAFDRVVELVVKAVLVDQNDKHPAKVSPETGLLVAPDNVLTPTTYNKKFKTHDINEDDRSRKATDKEVKHIFADLNGIKRKVKAPSDMTDIDEAIKALIGRLRNVQNNQEAPEDVFTPLQWEALNRLHDAMTSERVEQAMVDFMPAKSEAA